MKQLLTVSAVVAVLLFGSALIPCHAASNVLFILDGSGSMWGQVDGVAKIDTAKKVLTGLLKDLPKETNAGLMVYGHRSEGDCKDVELLIPLGPIDPGQMEARLAAIKPKGKTPLTYSIEQSQPLFAKLSGQSNHVVLVSDGKETCDGDPCDASAKLVEAGVEVKVHVVGFDVSDEERKQLECIAGQGKGSYFNAQNVQGFRDALAQVKEEVARPLPAPKNKEYFFDDFDGEGLKDHWEVINPNVDTYIVEDSGLLVVSSKYAVLSQGDVENLFRLNVPLPEGDWVMTAKVNVDFQTIAERVFLSLFEDKDNFITVHTLPTDGNYYSGYLYIEEKKFSKGAETAFRVGIWDGFKEGTTYASPAKGFKNLPQPILLRLRKEGRSYFGAAMLEGAESPKWFELEKLTVLRAKGNLAIGLYQARGDIRGETPVVFDWVKIETKD